MKLSWILILLPLASAFSQKRATVHGMVKDSFNLIQNIEVQLLPEKKFIHTDASGSFVFEEVSFGNHTLEIHEFGFLPFRMDVMVNQPDLWLDTLMLSIDRRQVAVEVKRKAKGEMSELIKTKKSISIVTIKSKETLDKLPNKNAADLASRMPSVMLFRSKGESNMVSLRGTPIDWTSVLIDGDRLPVACEDNATRSFEFEAFPSDFVSEVIEVRSVTPDFEADNIGGSLNFLTLEPTEEKTLHVDASLGFNFKGNKPSGDFNLLFSNRSKDKKWGYLVNTTYFGRTYASEAIKTIFGSNLNHGVNRLELRKYDGFRSTSGAQFAVTYQPSKRWEWKLNGFWGRMTDDKQMNKISFNWFEENGQRVRLQNCVGLWIRQVEGASLNLKVSPNAKTTGTFRLAGYLNQFKSGPVPFAKNDPRNGFFVTEFQSPELSFNDLSKVDLYGQAVDPNAQDFILLKLIGDDNPYGKGDDPLRILPNFNGTLNANDFEFTQSYTEINRTNETDPIVFKNDWEHLLNDRWKLQAGIKYRFKIGERSLSKHEWFQDYSGGNSSPILVSDLQTTPFQTASSVFLLHEVGSTYAPYQYDFLNANGLNQFLSEHDDKLREVAMNPLNFEYNQWVGSSYDYREQQSAAYGMATYAGKKIAMLAGLRIEHTYLVQSSDTLTSTIALDTASNTYYNVPETRTIRKSYIGFLPSININHYLSTSTTLKWAISRTMHRPNFEETKPGHAVIRYNEMEYTFGNPSLKPAFSYNVDFTYEKYHGNRGLFSVGAYSKYIRDHIYTMSALNTDPISGVTIRKYGNAPWSWVGGIEILYNRKFDFLPNKWRNLGVRSNLTLSMSRMKIEGRPANQAMTKQTPVLYNVNLFYEGKKLQCNVALLYTGRYVSDLNLTYINGELFHKNSDYDTYVNQNYALEATILYAINDHLALETQLTNLLNFPERKSLGAPWRSSYVEYYGARVQLGVTWSL